MPFAVTAPSAPLLPTTPLLLFSPSLLLLSPHSNASQRVRCTPNCMAMISKWPFSKLHGAVAAAATATAMQLVGLCRECAAWSEGGGDIDSMHSLAGLKCRQNGREGERSLCQINWQRVVLVKRQRSRIKMQLAQLGNELVPCSMRNVNLMVPRASLPICRLQTFCPWLTTRFRFLDCDMNATDYDDQA